MSEEDDYVVYDENINYKSITCEDIPQIFLDKLIAKKHFGKFGKIKRFILRPKRLSCTVEYESENDALEAIVNAGLFNGEHFSIRYTPKEVAHAKNTEEWIDPDVQAELDAMRPQVQRLPQSASVKTTGIGKLPKPILKTRLAANDCTIKIPDSGAGGELEAVLRRQAFNNEDRFRILDARDKLIRLTSVRTTDIRRAESIKGFCPDMCPEKERLLRENRNQIAIFELEEGTRNRMDHKLAVKEYSRSSADQETPLSHELRPEPVLKLTMTYLMHRIMDLCDVDDVNIADWYNFIWDRTRSIRKDITQQELCSLTTVELVEQCARFHIHCAARLAAEDLLVFDHKINTENLTKCLQTLKYMYHDLRLQNKKCPNEAEFRTYVILLNLNDSNFLWDMKQLPEEIQNSAAVRFALDTYLAMESNNYVRFFKLVREASYMNACILFRYFTQVRIRAIRAIMIAYKWPLHVVSIPITYFRDILAFESSGAARMFFEYHGLDCEGGKVTLDKKAFYIPEMPLQMERAISLVELKRQHTVGEAVSGHALDDVEMLDKHVPHNSFDENGYLKPDAWNAEDQLRGADFRRKQTMDSDGLFKIPSASPPISPKFKSPSPGLKHPAEPTKSQLFQPIAKVSTNQTQGLSAGNIFGLIGKSEEEASKPSVFSLPALNKSQQEAPQKTFTTSIFGGTATKSTHFNNSQNAALPTIFAPSTNSHPSPLFSDAQVRSILGSNDSLFKNFQTSPSLDIFKRPSQLETDTTVRQEDVESERQRREALEEENRKRQAELELQRLQRQEEEAKRFEEQREREMAEKNRQEKLQTIETKSAKILSEMLDQELLSVLHDVAVLEFQKYQSILSNSERLWIALLDEHLDDVLVAIANEEITIAATNQNLLEKYFTLWHANVRRAVEHRKLMESTPIWISDQSITEAHPQQSQTLEMMERYRLGVPQQFQLKSPSEKPIDIFRIFVKEFRCKVPGIESSTRLVKSRRYYKFVLSLPHENDEGFNSFMNSWLAKTIRRHSPGNSEEFLCESYQNISICLRKVEGIVPTSEKRLKVLDECDHAHGLVFIMSATNLLNSRKRLHHLLKLCKIHTKIPVAIITYNASVDEEYIEDELELQKLIDDEKISYYSLFPSTVFISKNNLREAFVETFKFLAKYTEQFYDLEMQQLCHFLRSALGDEFWKRLEDSSRINPSFRKLCTQPAKLASLYNEAIDLLIEMLSEDYEDMPEFPRELRKFVPQQIFDIPLDIEHFPTDWKEPSRNIKIQNFLKGIKLQPFPELSQNVAEIQRTLLEYSAKCIGTESYAKRAGYGAIKQLLESINSPQLQNILPIEEFNSISWLPVIASISLELLTFSWHSNNANLPQEIIYKKLAFQEYTSVPWWFENVTLKSIKMVKNYAEQAEREDELMTPSAAKRLKTSDIDTLLERSTSLLEKADRNISTYKEITTKSREMSRSFDEQLYKQELFNRKLKRYLQSNI